MFTKRYLMKSLKARGGYSDGRTVSDGGWIPDRRPIKTSKPKPEKPDFIKEGEFKV